VTRRGPVRFAPVVLAIVCLPAFAASQSAPSQPQQPRRILVLHQERSTAPTNAMNAGLMSAVRGDTTLSAEVFVEYLDHERNPDGAVQLAQLNYLKRKYEQHPIDVAVAVGRIPYGILTDSAKTITPKAQVVFWLNEPNAGTWQDNGRAVGGIVTRYDVAGTMSDILQLRPDTRKLLVVSGVTGFDTLALRHGLNELRSFGRLFEIEKMVGATQQQFLERIARLPPQSAVLLLNFVGDSLGQWYVPGDVAEVAARVSAAPIFALKRTLLGNGIVGGRLIDYDEHGRQLGEMALAALKSERSSLPVRRLLAQPPLYDGRALRQWDIPEHRLPQGAEVLFSHAVPWELYRNRILATLIVCLLEALLIGGMFVQRRRRARAERLLADRLHFETILADASRTFTDVHPFHISLETSRWLRRLCTFAEARQSALLLFDRDGVHLRRAEAWRGAEASDNAIASIDVDALIELKRGQVTTVSIASGQPGTVLVLVPIAMEGRTFGVLMIEATSSRLFGDSVPLDRSRVLGEIMAAAIARKHAAEELARQADALRASHVEYRRLADSLVEAQENERRRIARELHDDIAQRLTMLSLEAGEIGRRAGDAAIVPRSAIEHLTRELGTLVADMSRVSHRLHPSMLEKIGLPAALRTLTRDLSTCYRTPISFEEENVPGTLPGTSALALYRVAQEALRNAIRHSGATAIVVRVIHSDGLLSVEVQDNGIGLDEERLRRAPGLGITSMAERVEVLGGTFGIQSRTDAGTTVRASIRLTGEPSDFRRNGISIEAVMR